MVLLRGVGGQEDAHEKMRKSHQGTDGRDLSHRTERLSPLKKKQQKRKNNTIIIIIIKA